MKWFGASWGAPVCEPQDHVPCPEGRECPMCLKALQAGDQGVLLPFLGAREGGDPPDQPYHIRCFLKSVGVE